MKGIATYRISAKHLSWGLSLVQAHACMHACCGVSLLLTQFMTLMQGKDASAPFWKVYELYNIKDLKFDGIYWNVIPRQIPTALALFFVVAFGSSLDVAAIQQDSPDPLDYNKELVTVGKGQCCLQSCTCKPKHLILFVCVKSVHVLSCRELMLAVN